MIHISDKLHTATCIQIALDSAFRHEIAIYLLAGIRVGLRIDLQLCAHRWVGIVTHRANPSKVNTQLKAYAFNKG